MGIVEYKVPATKFSPKGHPARVGRYLVVVAVVVVVVVVVVPSNSSSTTTTTT